MEDHEELHAGAANATANHSSNHTPSATALSNAKGGVQLLHELLAIVYHVLEEAKYMNLKPPLQPSSKLFVVDAISNAPGSPPRSPGAPDSPTDEHIEMNGIGFGAAHGHGAGGHQPVIPYTPEEIQDSFTKIAHLKNQYIKISTELMEAVKKVPTQSEGQQETNKESMEKLIQRRNQLRREVYERNLVMKGLIDRLRHLQHSIRLMKGGSAYPPNVVMESV
ncbi:hypothetical protein FI667_g5177, partial [Globisporangium splendens]